MTDVLTRPNGKPYRRWAPIRVEEFTTHGDSTGYVVVGTHDVDEALELVRRLWEHDGDPTPGVRRWWRLVPWDLSGQFDRSWIDDPVRGAPVVTFDLDHHP